MIWANHLELLEFYLIGIFLISYVLYQLRLFLITGKKKEVNLANIFKKFLLRSIYFSLILISILGPSFGDVKKELKSEGKDIYIVLDISASMFAYDVPPSRLEKAKREIKILLKNLRYNDRVGIILFAREAFLQCPLTFDIAAVNLFLDAATPDQVNAQGSDIENALSFAYQKQRATDNLIKTPVSKVIVLVTDGETWEDGAIDYARKIKQEKISLFVLGVGTTKGSKIPIHPGFKRNSKNGYVVSHLNAPLLTKIASVNGENFYAIGKNSTQTSQLTDKLNSLEGTVKEVRKIDLSSNKYYYFLALALFFIIIDGLLTVNIIKI